MRVIKPKTNVQFMKEHNFTLYRGDTFEFEVKISGGQIDLSDMQYKMQIKPMFGDVLEPHIEKTDIGIKVLLPSAMTQELTWKTAEYDLQISYGDYVRTLLRGKFTMIKDITQ